MESKTKATKTRVEREKKLDNIANTYFKPLYFATSNPELIRKLLECSYERALKPHEDMIYACLNARQVYEKYKAKVEESLKD